MPSQSRDLTTATDLSTDHSSASSTARENSNLMLSNRNNGTGSALRPRGKLIEEETELLEQGNKNGESLAWDDEGAQDGVAVSSLSMRDKRALTLLIALCRSDLDLTRVDDHCADERPPRLILPLDLLQGIPVGLAFGSIPFLLRAKLSYSQIGIFTLCTYPYSLKLLWSPIVDSLFHPKLGRRKSWIVPVQTIVGVLLWWLGSNVQGLMEVVSLPHLCLGTLVLIRRDRTSQM